jgi:antitoxin MazE
MPMNRDAVIHFEQCGSSLGVRLPAAVVRAAHLRADRWVRVSVEGDQVVITPITDVHLSLE